MPLTVDQFNEAHETLKAAVSALDCIGSGVGASDAVDGSLSLTEAVDHAADKIAASLDGLAEAIRSLRQ